MKSIPANFEEKTFDPGPSFGSGGQFLHGTYSSGQRTVKGLWIVPENKQEKAIIEAVWLVTVFVGKHDHRDSFGLLVKGTGRSLRIPMSAYVAPEGEAPFDKYLITYVDGYADGMSITEELAKQFFEFLSSQKHDSDDCSITRKNMKQFLLDPKVAGLLYPKASKEWEISTDGLLREEGLPAYKTQPSLDDWRDGRQKKEPPKPKELQIGGPSPEEWREIEQQIADGPPGFCATDVRTPRKFNPEKESLPPTLEAVTCHGDKDPATGKEKVVYFAVCFHPPTQSFTLECFYDYEKAKEIDREGREKAEPCKAILNANIYTQTILEKLKAGEINPSDVKEKYTAPFRVGAKTRLCNVWVVCPDGTLRDPNKIVHARIGNKTWDVVGPEEMILQATGATLAIVTSRSLFCPLFRSLLGETGAW